jgi:hypothetical protein
MNTDLAGEQGRLDAAARLELAQDCSHVVLHRLLGEPEPAADLSIRDVGRNELQDLALSTGQLIKRIGGTRLGQAPDHHIGEPRRDVQPDLLDGRHVRLAHARSTPP